MRSQKGFTLLASVMMLAVAAFMALSYSKGFSVSGDAATTITTSAAKKSGNVKLTVKIVGQDKQKMVDHELIVPILSTDSGDDKATKINLALKTWIDLNQVAKDNIKSGVLGNVIVINGGAKVYRISVDSTKDETGQDMKIGEKLDKMAGTPVSAMGAPNLTPNNYSVLFYLDRDPSGVGLDAGHPSIMAVEVSNRRYEQDILPGDLRNSVYRALANQMRQANESVYFIPNHGVLVTSDKPILDVATQCLDEYANIGWKRFEN
jgi:hypothetical protein